MRWSGDSFEKVNNIVRESRRGCGGDPQGHYPQQRSSTSSQDFYPDEAADPPSSSTRPSSASPDGRTDYLSQDSSSTEDDDDDDDDDHHHHQAMEYRDDSHCPSEARSSVDYRTMAKQLYHHRLHQELHEESDNDLYSFFHGEIRDSVTGQRRKTERGGVVGEGNVQKEQGQRETTTKKQRRQRQRKGVVSDEDEESSSGLMSAPSESTTSTSSSYRPKPVGRIVQRLEKKNYKLRHRNNIAGISTILPSPHKHPPAHASTKRKPIYSSTSIDHHPQHHPPETEALPAILEGGRRDEIRKDNPTLVTRETLESQGIHLNSPLLEEDDGEYDHDTGDANTTWSAGSSVLNSQKPHRKGATFWNRATESDIIAPSPQRQTTAPASPPRQTTTPSSPQRQKQQHMETKVESSTELVSAEEIGLVPSTSAGPIWTERYGPMVGREVLTLEKKGLHHSRYSPSAVGSSDAGSVPSQRWSGSYSREQVEYGPQEDDSFVTKGTTTTRDSSDKYEVDEFRDRCERYAPSSLEEDTRTFQTTAEISHLMRKSRKHRQQQQRSSPGVIHESQTGDGSIPHASSSGRRPLKLSSSRDLRLADLQRLQTGKAGTRMRDSPADSFLGMADMSVEASRGSSSTPQSMVGTRKVLETMNATKQESMEATDGTDTAQSVVAKREVDAFGSVKAPSPAHSENHRSSVTKISQPQNARERSRSKSRQSSVRTPEPNKTTAATAGLDGKKTDSSNAEAREKTATEIKLQDDPQGSAKVPGVNLNETGIPKEAAAPVRSRPGISPFKSFTKTIKKVTMRLPSPKRRNRPTGLPSVDATAQDRGDLRRPSPIVVETVQSCSDASAAGLEIAQINATVPEPTQPGIPSSDRKSPDLPSNNLSDQQKGISINGSKSSKEEEKIESTMRPVDDPSDQKLTQLEEIVQKLDGEISMLHALLAQERHQELENTPLPKSSRAEKEDTNEWHFFRSFWRTARKGTEKSATREIPNSDAPIASSTARQSITVDHPVVVLPSRNTPVPTDAERNSPIPNDTPNSSPSPIEDHESTKSHKSNESDQSAESHESIESMNEKREVRFSSYNPLIHELSVGSESGSSIDSSIGKDSKAFSDEEINRKDDSKKRGGLLAFVHRRNDKSKTTSNKGKASSFQVKAPVFPSPTIDINSRPRQGSKSSKDLNIVVDKKDTLGRHGGIKSPPKRTTKTIIKPTNTVRKQSINRKSVRSIPGDIASPHSLVRSGSETVKNPTVRRREHVAGNVPAATATAAVTDRGPTTTTTTSSSMADNQSTTSSTDRRPPTPANNKKRPTTPAQKGSKTATMFTNASHLLSVSLDDSELPNPGTGFSSMDSTTASSLQMIDSSLELAGRKDTESKRKVEKNVIDDAGDWLSCLFPRILCTMPPEPSSTTVRQKEALGAMMDRNPNGILTHRSMLGDAVVIENDDDYDDNGSIVENSTQSFISDEQWHDILNATEVLAIQYLESERLDDANLSVSDKTIMAVNRAIVKFKQHATQLGIHERQLMEAIRDDVRDLKKISMTSNTKRMTSTKKNDKFREMYEYYFAPSD